jgi:hypothetical protein
MFRSIFFALCLHGLCTIALLPAQSGEPGAGAAGTAALAARAGGFAPGSVMLGWAHDGRLWAMGSSYKAVFEDGIQMIPYFGSGALDAYPIALRLTAAHAGGQPIALAPAAVQREGAEVVFDRGPLDEVYAVALDQIEQLFRIAQPLGAGDLVLEVTCATDLSVERHGDGFLFANALGSVRMSDAILVDATGRRTGLTMTHSSGRFLIEIPAGVLESAVYPIVVDPTLTVVNPTEIFPYEVVDTDVAYEAQTQRWLVTYETAFTVNDHDVWVRRLDSQGTPLPAVDPVAAEAVDFTTQNWQHPRVAANGFEQSFFVVCQRRASVINSWRISGVIVEPVLEVLGAVSDVSSLLGDCLAPDIGGDPSTSPQTYYYVVYSHPYATNDHDVYGMLVSSNGTPFSTQEDALALSLEDEREVTISTSNGFFPLQEQHWIVAWTEGTAPNRDIRGVEIDWAGTQSTDFDIEVSALDTRLPSVSTLAAGSPHRYVVAYETAVAQGVDVGFTLMESSIVRLTHSSLHALQGTPFAERAHPAVDASGCAFAMAFQEGTGIAAQVRTTGFLAAAYGSVLFVESMDTLGTPTVSDLGPALACTWSAGATDRRHMVTWTADNSPGSATPPATAAAALRELPGGLGTVTRVPLGTDGLAIDLYGAPSLGQMLAVGLCNAGAAPCIAIGTPVPAHLVCTLPVGLDLVAPLAVVPGTYLAGVVPMNPSLVGMTFAFQGADFSGTGCYGYRVSDVLQVTIQ